MMAPASLHDSEPHRLRQILIGLDLMLSAGFRGSKKERNFDERKWVETVESRQNGYLFVKNMLNVCFYPVFSATQTYKVINKKTVGLQAFLREKNSLQIFLAKNSRALSETRSVASVTNMAPGNWVWNLSFSSMPMGFFVVDVQEILIRTWIFQPNGPVFDMWNVIHLKHRIVYCIMYFKL